MTQLIESEEQIAEFKECFNLYDRDNDGLISTDQMKLVIRSLGQSPSDRELKEIQANLGKAKITFPEFLEVMAKMIQKTRSPEQDIDEGFRIYDTKKQGVVSIKDLRHIMTRTGEKLSQSEFEYMLKEAGVPKNASHVRYSDLAKAFRKV